MVKVLVEEVGSDIARELVGTADGLVTSELTYLETHSALARMRRGDRLAFADHAAKLRDFEAGWIDTATVAVTSALIQLGSRLAGAHSLRAYDALHLASATSVRGERFAFACWDHELREAADAEGLTLVPSSLSA